MARQSWLALQTGQYGSTSFLFSALICVLVATDSVLSTDGPALARYNRALMDATNGVIVASAGSRALTVVNGTNSTASNRHGFQREMLSATTTLPPSTTVTKSDASGERRIKECHFTRTQGRLRAESAYKQISGIASNECQSLCQNLPSCKSFSYGRLADNGTSECLLSEKSPADDSNILRPRTTAVGTITQLPNGNKNSDNSQRPEAERFYLYEKTEKGCIEVSFECGASTILVSVQTSDPFNGLVYTEGTVDPGCIVDIADKTNFAISVPIEDLQCNSVYNGHGEFSNTIVVQWDKRIVTRKDRRFRISCQYELGDMQITHKPFEIQNLSPLSMTHKVPQPDTFIRLLGNNGEEMQEASVGETTTFRIEIAAKDSPYRIFARDCRAMGEREQEVLELIDAKGCPVYPEVFPALKQVGSNLEARFQTFRFRTSYSVTFTCTIDYCIDKCEPAKCEGGTLAMGRRRRRSLDDASSLVMDHNDHFTPNSHVRRSLHIIDQRPPQYNYSRAELFKVQDASRVVELIRQRQQYENSNQKVDVAVSSSTPSLVTVTWILFSLACLFLIISVILGVLVIVRQKANRRRETRLRENTAAVIGNNPRRPRRTPSVDHRSPSNSDENRVRSVYASPAPTFVIGPHGLNPKAFSYYEQALAPFTEEQRKHFYAHDQYAK